MSVEASSVMELILNGVMLGFVYSLFGLSMLLVGGVLKLIDLARGDLAIATAYVICAFTWEGRIPVILALLPAMVVACVAGLGLERWIYRPLQGQPRYVPLVAALGLSLVLQGMLQLGFGSELVAVPGASDLRKPIGEFLGVRLARLDLLVVGTFLTVAVIVQVLLTQSRLGRAARAIADDEGAAAACGVSLTSTRAWVFLLAAIVGGVAGLFHGLLYGLEPGAGLLLTIKAFIVATLAGGRGVAGALFGGLILGVAESLLSGLLPANYRDAYVFVVLLGLLLAWPSGIGGRATRRYV